MGVLATAVIALAAGYLLNRLRPWRRLGDWAADQIRLAGDERSREALDRRLTQAAQTDEWAA
ncbi:hypothetical protein ABT373_27045 [Streptomyces sp. NPDC000070]|uniref:hypothetical protein n=1 Tax=Streptomyces sp. NPDC000070 TaxID=3154240 RepID=UPI003332823E